MRRIVVVGIVLAVIGGGGIAIGWRAYSQHRARSLEPAAPIASPEQRAVETARTACAGGDASSCVVACDAKDAVACESLAAIAAKVPTPEDKDTGEALAWARACQAGSVKGCRWLGENGAHTDVNAGDGDGTFTASERYRAWACRSDAQGCAGTVGGKRSLSLVALSHWLDIEAKACESGEAHACVTVANAHLSDQGLPLDYTRAAQLFSRACEKDPKEGCLALSNLVERGRGVPLDLARAEVLARRSCASATHDARGWRCAGEPPVLRVGTTQINGRVPVSVLHDLVGLRATHLRYCWDGRGLPAGRGQISLKFAIALDGQVKAAENAGATNVDPATAECILNVVREMRFPPPAGGVVTIIYNFEIEYSGR